MCASRGAGSMQVTNVEGEGEGPRVREMLILC
jgi:hypothetical protein